MWVVYNVYEQTRNQNAIFTHHRPEKIRCAPKNSLLKWYSPFCRFFFHFCFCYLCSVCRLCTCVYLLFRLVIQWMKISHLAFKVVNVCQNELTFKIYFHGFSHFFAPLFTFTLLSSFSRCVRDSVLESVCVYVRLMWPSFSLHSKFLAAIFSIWIFSCIYVCVAQSFCSPQWCALVCYVCSLQCA